MNDHDQAAVDAGETTEGQVAVAEARRAEGGAMVNWLRERGIYDVIPEDERLSFGVDEGGLYVEYHAFAVDADGDIKIENVRGPVRWPNGTVTIAVRPEAVLVLRRHAVTMLPRVRLVDLERRPADHAPGTFPQVDVPADEVTPAVGADPPR